MFSLNPRISEWKHLKIWLIGASSGIGQALAYELQRHGGQLALSARSTEKLNQIATTEDLVLPVDVCNSDALTKAYRQLMSSWGHIDLMIYCVGVYTPMKSNRMTQDAIREAIAVNLSGAYQAVDLVLPEMIKRSSGSLCLVASVAGYTGLPRAVAYGPTKAAMINLAEILYTELAPQGIGVYLVNPGFVDTRLTKQNDFKMPALISPQEAAKNILKGFAKGKFEIHFPWRFSILLKFISRLPYRLRFSILKGLDV